MSHCLTFEQGMDLEWCKNPEVGLPKPDVVLYLTLSAEEAAKRPEFGGERYDRTDFQARVAENYKLLEEQDWKVSCVTSSNMSYFCNPSHHKVQSVLSTNRSCNHLFARRLMPANLSKRCTKTSSKL